MRGVRERCAQTINGERMRYGHWVGHHPHLGRRSVDSDLVPVHKMLERDDLLHRVRGGERHKPYPAVALHAGGGRRRGVRV